MIVIRLFLWLIRRLGVPTFLALLLVFIALGSLLFQLSATVRAFDSSLAVPLLLGGVMLGWGLAKSPLPGWLAGLMLVSGGLDTLIIRVGVLSQDLVTFFAVLLRLVWATWHWPTNGPPDVTPLWQQATQIGVKVSVLAGRLLTWGQVVLNAEVAQDPVVATLLWGLFGWAVASWAGWAVRRQRNPWLALTPAGVVLLTVSAYQRQTSTSLTLFLMATLLLVALVNYQAGEQGWRKKGLSFSRELRVDVALAVVPLSLGLVIVAMITSWLLFGPLNTALYRLLWGPQEAEQNVVANSLGLNPAPQETTTLEQVRRGGLPRSHLLGSGPELSEQVVLVIETNDPPPSPDMLAPRYYWRSLTYDRYNGRGWTTGRTQRLDYQANERVQPEGQPGRILSQTVQTTDRFNGLLSVAGELITADQAFSVEWRGPNDIFGASLDVSDSYQAQSRLPVFSEAHLRAAGADYPDSIKNRYLSLPDSVPNRVLSLARDLTATAPTPYDQAQAIESYLRTFPYTLDLPAPPVDQDIADYFLFELRQGYCDYYATAMVTLARAAGLPARLAVGYIQGRYEAENKRYIITEAEAHSWVEIYFPGRGWVNFEPTGGRPALERENEIAPPATLAYESTPAPSFLETTLPTSLREKGFKSPLFWVGLPSGAILLFITLIFVWKTVDIWHLRRLTPGQTVSVLHHRLYLQGQRFNLPTVTGHTPYEFALMFVEWINNFATRSRWGRYLTPASQEVQRLTHFYVRTCYSPHHFDRADQSEAIRLWQHLQGRLWLAWLLLKLKRKA